MLAPRRDDCHLGLGRLFSQVGTVSFQHFLAISDAADADSVLVLVLPLVPGVTDCHLSGGLLHRWTPSRSCTLSLQHPLALSPVVSFCC